MDHIDTKLLESFFGQFILETDLMRKFKLIPIRSDLAQLRMSGFESDLDLGLKG